MYAFVHVSAASPDAMQPVEALLDVSAYPDQAISTISFNFWHRLMRRLVLGEHSTSAQQDGEVITSHSQDPAMNSHSAVRIPPRHNFPPPSSSPTHTPPIASAFVHWQSDCSFYGLLAFLTALHKLAYCRVFC